MNLINPYRFCCLAAFAWLLASCSTDRRQIVVSEFEALTNFEFKGDTLVMEMDLDSGPFRGIRLPSARMPVGKQSFKYKFKATNTSKTPRSVAYKIYYQNESYKHPETIGQLVGRDAYNPKSAENFYGSWVSDQLEGFRTTVPIASNEGILVEDEFTILGNPLNEERYFGANPIDMRFREIDIQEVISSILIQPEWYASIGEKAFQNKVDTAVQLRGDAIWVLENRKAENVENQRWQRNPRVGSYRFMLVVGDAESIAKLPASILNMANLDPELKVRVNPFYYFKWGDGSFDALSSGITVLESQRVLQTFAVLRPDMGIYYRQYDYDSIPSDPSNFCSAGDDMYMLAHFEQYRNTPIRDSSLNNVDIAANVAGAKYAYSDYKKAAKSKDRVPNSYVEMASIPCENVFYDPEFNGITVQNKGNTSRPYTKQNAGVKGRVGFTYGKFRARIKFPQMLSQDHVWNGVTCAYWLIFQSLDPWNYRDICEGSGYLKSGYSPEDAVYQVNDAYSEIDIEIVKESKFWQGATEFYGADTSGYRPARDHNLMVTCTNWDQACTEPENFSVYTVPYTAGNTTYYPHRWSQYYKAITIKTEHPHDLAVGDVYSYEIEWKPTSITWWLGADEHSMKQMAYMDDKLTKIPNNQMVPVMSQEFHYGHWWPTSPYQQGNIPYPSQPISGMIYEVVVE